jgi:hypothetical protein
MVCCLLITFAIAGCQPAGTTTTLASPTSTEIVLPSQTPTSAPTLTPIPPTTTPAAPGAFYHLRLDISTTSDWTTLELLNPEHILTARMIRTEGDPTSADVGVAHIALNQPLEAALKGARVSLTADLALDPAAAGTSLQFLSQKGDVFESAVRVSVVSGGEVQILDEVQHTGAVPRSEGLNPFNFGVDLTPLSAITPERVALSGGSFTHLLWAFYYPWYSRDSWSSSELSDHPLTPYDSSDRGTIERQVRLAKDVGIDGFISSWWGPDSETDANLRTLLDVAQQEDFLVTLYFETLTDGGPRPADEIVGWLSYALRTYGDHPAFAKVDGKPVIVVWASETVPLATWAEIMDEVRKSGLDAFILGMGYGLSKLDVFDGLHEYGVFTIPDLELAVSATGKAVHYYGLLEDEPSNKLWAATVQPGYDDRLIPGREGLVQERDDGAFYRRTWEAALASEPDWIFIATWNEWYENTHIEPSEAFGELYLDLTREYAAEWTR